MKKIISCLLVVAILCSCFAGLNIVSSATDLPTSGQIGENVFYTFDSQTGLLTISGTGAIVGDYGGYGENQSPFYNQSAIKTVVINEGVTSIGHRAFQGCSSLINVTIPDTVNWIGIYAFSGCSGLTNIFIPDSVGNINAMAFNGCGGIIYSGYATGTPWGASEHLGTRDKNFLYEDSKQTRLKRCISEKEELIIPDSVIKICDSAFSGCSGLTSITIPDSVTSIGEHAFHDCRSLTNISIPNSVISIGESAFKDCNNLTNLSIGTAVSSIGKFAFEGCNSLTKVVIPDSVTALGGGAFYGCESLNEVHIGSGVTKLTDVFVYNYQEDGWPVLSDVCGTFGGCKKLEEIVLPVTLESITPFTFDSSGLKKITFLNENISIDDTILNNDWVKTHPLTCPKQITQIIILIDSVSDCSDDIKKWIGNSSITDLVIPETWTYIPDGLCKDCKTLTTVTIPKSVTRIEYNAFSGCTNLTIRGYKDSYAETFCKWAGIPFEVIEEPHTHSYTAVVTPPTCTEQGFTTHTCTCGDSYVDTYTQATGHSWSGWQVEIAANCTEKGVEIRQCSNDNSHTESRNIAALGHDYVPEVIQPKATSLGYTRYSCSRCDDTYIKDFKAPTGKLGGFKCKARTSVAQTVTWNKVNSATGYQVQISTKDGKKWSTYANLGLAVNSYTFKKLSAGNNYKFRVRFYIKAADGKNYYGAWSSTLNSPTLPAATVLTKVSAGSKSFTAQWKKQAVTGYQIQYSVNSSFKSAKIITVGSKNTTKKSISKLKGGTKYFVRIRTYKKIGNAKYYSAWSKAYTVKTKK